MTNFRRAAATAATALMAFNTGAIACTTGCGQPTTPAPTFTYNAGFNASTAFTGTVAPVITVASTNEGSKAQAIGDVKVQVAGDTYSAPKPAVSSAISYAPGAGICDKTGAFAINLRDVAFSVSGSAKQDFCIGAVYTIVPNFLRLGYNDAATNYLLQGNEDARMAFARSAQMEENEAARAAAGLPPLGKYARFFATGVAPLDVKPAAATAAPAPAYNP